MRKDMTKKKIKSLILIALFVVMAVSVSIISYSILSKEGKSKDIKSDIAQREAVAGDPGYITIIDRIIENSYLTDDTAYYKVVEILPQVGVTYPTSLEKYITTGDFKKYVIDEHKDTVTMDMAPDKIRYTPIIVNSTTDEEDALVLPAGYTTGYTRYVDALSDADLFYLSSPAYESYRGVNNISEDIFNLLKLYALTDLKPIIMDYVSPTATADDTTYASMIRKIAHNNIVYRSFAWNMAKFPNASDFFATTTNAAGDVASYYLKFNVDYNNVTGRILVVSNTTDGSSPMAKSMKDFYDADNDDFISAAYFGTKAKFPDEITFSYATPGDLMVNVPVKAGFPLADGTTVPSNQYDMIIIENDVMPEDLDADFDTWVQLSMASQYIIFDKENVPSDSTVDENLSKYYALMNLLMTSSGAARYANILSVDHAFFDVTGDASRTNAELVANLINGSDYRGSSTDGSNGKKYRVLELQPCYPIDLELAKKKIYHEDIPFNSDSPFKENPEFKGMGNYYTDPVSMIYDDMVEDGSAIGELKEYYKFEISRAKIAEALGVPFSEIVIEQMSTEQFISEKEVVLETYDLVYIGGDHSALTPLNFVRPFGASAKDVFPVGLDEYLPLFNMYSHTGYPVAYKVTKSAGAGGADLNGRPYGYVDGYANSSSVLLNGNDLTKIKLEELKKYIDAGMPIVFGKEVTTEFDKVYAQTNRLNQLLNFHMIDPDSNMYELLTYAKLAKKDKESILWNFDPSSYKNADDERCQGTDGRYGTYPLVSVFTEKSRDKIADTVEKSATRPSLKLLSRPKEYKETDSGTWNENVDGKMTIRASAAPTNDDAGATFTLKLLVDMDGNGVFSEENELVDSKTSGANLPVDLIYDLDGGTAFFGCVSWKVVAEQTGANGQCVMASGFAYYKNNGEPKPVRVLQIMPRDVLVGDPIKIPIGEMDSHTLYMCTECQQATYRAEYNIARETLTADPLIYTRGDRDEYEGVKLGDHEHKFGIVKYDAEGAPASIYDQKYANGLGSDQWNDNFADLLSKDYDFQLDIMYLDELAEYSKAARDVTLGGTPEFNIDDVANAKSDWEDLRNSDEIIAAREALNEFLTDNMISTVDADGDGDLDAYPYEYTIINNIGGSNLTVTLKDDDVRKWIEHEAYYKAFDYLGYSNSTFNNLYETWRVEHDKVVQAYRTYSKTKLKAYGSGEYLSQNYDAVILGFAENFGGRDLDEARFPGTDECNDLKSFAENGGTILTTHDSTTHYADAGAVNLTNNLREVFGMDRFHMTTQVLNSKDESYYSYDSGSSSSDNVPFYIGAQDGDLIVGIAWKNVGPIQTWNKDVTVKFSVDDRTTEVIETGDEVPEGETISVTFEVYPSASDFDDPSKIKSKAGLSSFYHIYSGADTSSTALYNVDSTLTSGALLFTGIPSVARPDEEGGDDAFADLPALEGAEKKISGIYQTFSLKPDYAGQEDKYFMSPISMYDSSRGLWPDLNGDGTADTPEYADTQIGQKIYWYDSISNILSSGAYFGPISPVGLTDTSAVCESQSATGPYLFAETSFTNNGGWSTSIWDDRELNRVPGDYLGGTDKASQNNKGIVTQYPFTLSSELDISKTHTQTFALDLEDPNIAVWYSLAGCGGKQKGVDHSQYADESLVPESPLKKIRSSMFAASPRDGMDSYFLYSKTYGNGFINYCGAGHFSVTGIGRNNNDERRLYINLIVNTVRGKGSSPRITVHEKDKPEEDLDPTKNTNPKIDKKGEIVYTVDENTEIPEFDYKVLFNKKTSIRNMKVFYDLNYGEGTGYNKFNTFADDANHVLIYEYDKTAPANITNDLTAGRIVETEGKIIGRLRADLYKNGSDSSAVDLLKLKPEYFSPYGNYTYIVIWAIDDEGKSASQRVKIKLRDFLFDLTDAGFEGQYLTSMDMYDKTKFNF